MRAPGVLLSPPVYVVYVCVWLIGDRQQQRALYLSRTEENSLVTQRDCLLGLSLCAFSPCQILSCEHIVNVSV